MNRLAAPPARSTIVFATGCWLLATGAAISLRGSTLAGAADGGGGDTLSQGIWLLAYGACAALLLVAGDLLDVLRRVPWPVWGIVALAMVSILWSADAATSARRAIALAGSTLVGAWLADRLPLRTQLRCLAWAFALAMLLSLTFVVAAPGLGIMRDVRGSDWRGAFAHKNTLGIMMSIGVVVTATRAALTQGMTRAAWLAALSGCVLVLAGSGSRTGMVLVAGTGCLTAALLLATRAAPMLRLAALLIAVPTVVVATWWGVTHLGTVTGLIGRDATLTGRSDIWQATWASIERRPLLGYGYEAFWGNAASPARDVWLRFGVGFGVTDFRAMSAHNGWLNTWLGLGAAGVLLAATLLVTTLVRTLRRLADRVQLETVTLLWLLLLVTGVTLVEGALTTPNSFIWILVVVIATDVRHIAPRQDTAST